MMLFIIAGRGYFQVKNIKTYPSWKDHIVVTFWVYLIKGRTGYKERR